MKILFYLPVVTPWWFDNIIKPMIGHLLPIAEVHVMVPPLWSGTGVGPEQLRGLADSESIAWHILDGDDHPKLRVSAAGFDDLIELVHAIDPDITLCRSADVETPRRFPGIVRYVMEAGFSPFPAPSEVVVFRENPFDHGILPPMDAPARDRLASAFAPAWERTHARFDEMSGGRPAMLERLGLGTDRPVIALPLEYEHKENFFLIHRSIRGNAELVAAVAEELGADVQLAVSDHPLNRLYVKQEPLRESLARLPDRVVLIESGPGLKSPTTELARACAGMIVDNSKVFSLGAFFGTPIARTSSAGTGSWMNAASDLPAFARALCNGGAAPPDEDGARTWFAFHVANSLLHMSHPDVDGHLIVEMIRRPVDPGRWSAGLGRYADIYPGLFQ